MPALRPATGDAALGPALERAGRRPRLSAEEERRLAVRAARGDRAARDRLAEAHLRLVIALARTFGGRGVPHADLVQEGMDGLLRALDAFDPARGARLATYATWWIRRAMLAAITQAPAIRLPEDGRRGRAAILRVEAEASSHGRRRPAEDALAEATGLTQASVRRLRTAAHVVASLDEPVGDGDATLGELTADGDVLDAAAAVTRAEAAREVRAALRLVDPRTRRVLWLRFGLGGEEAATYEEIGAALGLSAEGARQVEAAGLRRLRAVAERAALGA